MGYDFFGVDLPGHGKSEGKTCLISSIEEFAQHQVKFQRMVYDKFYSD